MPKRPTIRDVADRAGVSIATVSKVANQAPSGMSDATRERVETAIREIGYRPNRMGRSLRTLKRSAIGIAIVDPAPRFLADPFTTNLVAGLANHLNARDVGLLLHGIVPGALESSSLIRELEVDALCLNLSGVRRERVAAMRVVAGLGQPFVAFQDLPDPSLKDACFVRQDDRAGAVLLAERLVRGAPRRAAMFVADVAWPAVEQRIAGIRSVFDPRGVALDLVESDETSSEAIAGGIAGYLDASGAPDVVVGQNDQIASAAIQALRRRGLRVPQDVEVSGFNAFPFSAFADSGMLTIRSRAYELGQLGAEILLERLASGRFRRREHVLALTPQDLVEA